jgi:hypothetical protein
MQQTTYFSLTEKEILKNIKPDMTREELIDQLRRLHLTKEEKAAMYEMSRKTVVINGKSVKVGLWAMETVLNIVRKFPFTVTGAVVGLAFFFLLGSIPLIGPLLAAVAGPIIALITVGMGLMQDLGFQVQAMVNESMRIK